MLLNEVVLLIYSAELFHLGESQCYELVKEFIAIFKTSKAAHFDLFMGYARNSLSSESVNAQKYLFFTSVLYKEYFFKPGAKACMLPTEDICLE